MNILILAAAAAISTVPASGSATVQPVASQGAQEVLVCRKEAVVGSRLPVKICESRASRADAEGRTQHSRQALEQMQLGAFTGRPHIN